MNERTDEEILRARATVMLYPKKVLHILSEVLGYNYEDFGLLMAMVMLYSIGQSDEIDEEVLRKNNPTLWAAFQQYRYELDADAEAYIKKSRRNAIAGSLRGRKKKENKETEEEA